MEEKLPNLLFSFTGLIPSINFISPLNRHYVKMRRLTRIFKSNTGHFSENDLSDWLAVKQSWDLRGHARPLWVWKLWHNNLIILFSSWNTNDWHQYEPQNIGAASLVSNIYVGIIMLSTGNSVTNIYHQNRPEAALIIFTFRPDGWKGGWGLSSLILYLQGNYVLLFTAEILKTKFGLQANYNVYHCYSAVIS